MSLIPSSKAQHNDDVIGYFAGDGNVIEECPNITVSSGYFDPKYNALYDQQGCIIDCSALRGRGRHNTPEQITLNQNVLTAPVGVYGGVLFGVHYGHFLIDTMSRLWPYMNQEFLSQWGDRPLIFRMAKNSKRDIAPVAESILRTLGVWDRVQIPPNELLIERCIIPHLSIRYDRDVHREYATFMRQVGDALLETTSKSDDWKKKKIYLSRAKLRPHARMFANEGKLESELKRHGYIVVHPQKMSLIEQVRMFKDSAEIVGPIGSAFHTTVLAGNTEQKLKYLVHNPPRGSTAYNNIDAVMNRNTFCIQCVFKHPLNLKNAPREDLVIDVQLAVETILGT